MTRTLRVGTILPASCLLLAAMSGSIRCARLDFDEMAYRSLENPSARGADQDACDDIAVAVDSPAVVGWIDIDNPELSYPVVQPCGDTPRTWYLNHDAWGNASELGCPYLDVRSSVNGIHLLVYGHRVVGSDYMFGPLSSAYDPEIFRTLGTMRWESRDGSQLLCTPLCALRVRETYQPIQQFNFVDTESFIRWLRHVTKDASAVSDTVEASISSSTRAVTLVTCSGNLVGSSWRTLVVYSAR